MAKITMFASNFSKYGSIRAMKSTLEFLAKEAGHVFVFVNDPLRMPNNIKVNFDNKETYLGKPLQAKEINAKLAKLENVHA